jgi:hypothetical protein
MFDDSLAAVFPGRRANVARPLEAVLEMGDKIGHLFVEIVHSEVVVREGQSRFPPDSPGDIEQVRFQIFEGMAVDLAVRLYGGVTKGAAKGQPRAICIIGR